jgi:hypothetical protein
MKLASFLVRAHREAAQAVSPNTTTLQKDGDEEDVAQAQAQPRTVSPQLKILTYRARRAGAEQR